jgi:hypothetical protein
MLVLACIWVSDRVLLYHMHLHMQLLILSLTGVNQVEGVSLSNLPADMQRVILGYLPLVDLARLACVNNELRTAYVDRVTERDTAVAALLESHFTAEFREGLSPTQRALPYDLIVLPQVREPTFL